MTAPPTKPQPEPKNPLSCSDWARLASAFIGLLTALISTLH